MPYVCKIACSFCLVIALLILPRCNKNEGKFNLEIAGMVTDQTTQKAIAGVTVILSAQEIKNGIWSASYKEIAKTTTNTQCNNVPSTATQHNHQHNNSATTVQTTTKNNKNNKNNNNAKHHQPPTATSN